jgi:phosphoglycolate phosphatase-like HAD superfamily hydrolase
VSRRPPKTQQGERHPVTHHRLPERLEDYEPSGATYRGTGRYVLFGIDSDGCVDKGMRAKHGGPFPRAGIEVFHLEPIAEAWRIAWAYVNEIEDRGCPRFKALALAVDRAGEMPVVREAIENKVVALPPLAHLKRFLDGVARAKGYGDNVLAEYLATLSEGDEKRELSLVARWSKKVNEYVKSDCPFIPPYRAAIAAITLAAGDGVDCMIVSGTPEEHLRETWVRHGLAAHIRGVFGRESGKKEQHLIAAMRAGRARLGRPYDVAIMFGDAPGDDASRLAASRELGVRVGFMPIRVGHEEDDWGWFLETFLRPGTIDRYDERIEAERILAFRKNLERPWNPDADVTRLFG